MRSNALRLVLASVIVAMAASGCAKKKPTITDTSTSAQGVGDFGPGGVAGTAPGGYGIGPDGQPLPPGVYLDANGNYVDANGNPVDANGNPLTGGGAYGQGTTYVDANGNLVDAYGNPIGDGGLYDNSVPTGTYAQDGYAQGGANAGAYNFAGDDGSPNYFAQRVGDRVLFDTDSSSLDGEAQETLRRQAAWLGRHPEAGVTIEGHADERGTRDYNLALGARRANAVRSYLVQLGLPGNRIRTVSYGKERPVAPSSTPGAWRVNRRAVTTLRGVGAGY